MNANPDDAAVKDATISHPSADAKAAIGERVRVARGDRAQADVAAELGISQASLSRVEAGDQHLSAVALARLCAITGRSPGWLLTGVEG